MWGSKVQCRFIYERWTYLTAPPAPAYWDHKVRMAWFKKVGIIHSSVRFDCDIPVRWLERHPAGYRWLSDEQFETALEHLDQVGITPGPGFKYLDNWVVVDRPEEDVNESAR